MQVDKNLKNELLSLSDDSLANIVKSVASAAGMNADKLTVTKDNVEKIRKAILNATDKDAAEALRIIGGEKNAREIIKQAKENRK